MSTSKPSSKIALLSTAPLPRALAAMGLPTMIGMMINALYNLVDAYFVGSLGTSPMGAISVTFPLSQAVVGLGLLFGSGGASYISRLLGRNDHCTANEVASTALYGSLALGAVIIAAMLLFLRPLLTLMGATETILPYALSYARIYIASAVLSIFNVTMNNLATGEGAAKTTMCALLSGALVNMLLDPLFIYTLRLGVAGAALASALSQAVSTAIYAGYILLHRSAFRFRPRDCRFTPQIMTEILKIGVPTLVFQLLTSLSVTLINGQAAIYGDSVIAGMGAVTRVMSMGSLMVFGFIKGFQPIAGYSYGAKDGLRLREAIRTTSLWATIFCAVFGAVMALFPSAVIAQFTAGDAMFMQVGQRALRLSGITFVLFGVCTVYSSLFLAIGRGGSGFLLGACRQGLCFAPMILLLPRFLGLDGILYAQPAADLLTALATAAMALRLHRSGFYSAFELTSSKQ